MDPANPIHPVPTLDPNSNTASPVAPVSPLPPPYPARSVGSVVPTSEVSAQPINPPTHIVVPPSQGRDLSLELTHANEEMYKKNLELAASNKTLSILRKVDEIIMGSVTDLVEIANQVATLAVHENVFKLIYIFSLNRRENSLNRLAFACDESINAHPEVTKRLNYLETISLLNKDNIAVQVMHSQKITMTNDLYGILSHNDG